MEDRFLRKESCPNSQQYSSLDEVLHNTQVDRIMKSRTLFWEKRATLNWLNEHSQRQLKTHFNIHLHRENSVGYSKGSLLPSVQHTQQWDGCMLKGHAEHTREWLLEIITTTVHTVKENMAFNLVNRHRLDKFNLDPQDRSWIKKNLKSSNRSKY